jgi:hypothetical protein
VSARSLRNVEVPGAHVFPRQLSFEDRGNEQ